jgi:hypothetical protein
MYGKRYGDFGPAFAAEKLEEMERRVSSGKENHSSLRSGQYLKKAARPLMPHRGRGHFYCGLTRNNVPLDKKS